MSGFQYRFSIIPPGAIIDPRVTPRALQVLCLLGRHIDNGGWCTRSQVKMAKELGCSRSAVQEACDILLETDWVERRRNGRGSLGPEASEQPFAAYSYRVRIDRDERTEAIVSDDVAADEGAAEAAGGATLVAGGAAEAAPLEGISSEGISSEGERDARARGKAHEKFAKWLAAFKLSWPTAAADDQTRIANAGRGLTETERDVALAKVPAFLDYLRRTGRTRVMAGWKYLEEKRWTLLEQPEAKASASRPIVPEKSEQGLIWRAVIDIAGHQHDGFPAFWLSGPPTARMVAVPSELPAALIALDTDRSGWVEVRDVDRNGHFAAWLRWLQARDLKNNFIRFAPSRDGRVLRVPFDWPPRKDGSIGQSSDPPEESTAA